MNVAGCCLEEAACGTIKGVQAEQACVWNRVGGGSRRDPPT